MNAPSLSCAAAFWLVSQAPAGAELTPSVPPVAAAVDLGFFASVMSAGTGEKCVMALLLALSVVSWAIILLKTRALRRAVSESETFLDVFWSSKQLDAIYTRAEKLGASPVGQMFRAGYVELAKLRKKSGAQPQGAGTDEQSLGDLESIARSMKRAQSAEMAALEGMVPFLGTVASTAPFIGLLGTVIGIIGAFREIGVVGNANLATVAPGIGGALVATAFGLFAAIPAVVGFNFFVARLRIIETEMTNFSADFLNIVKRHFF